MAGAITVTSMTSFKDQTGDLVLVSPLTTSRPYGHWSVPSWFRGNDQVFYESCARINNTSNNDIIYIASSTNLPFLSIAWDGSTYTFDSSKTRKNVNRILITNASNFPVGNDYKSPLRRKEITSVASYSVTVQNVSGNKYFLNGMQQASITVTAGDTITFTQSNSSNASHPIGIYTNSSKSVQVTAGVTSTGTAGTNGLVKFVPTTPGTYSYQCINHAGMGGTITVL